MKGEPFLETLDNIEDRIAILQKLVEALSNAQLRWRAIKCWDEILKLTVTIKEIEKRIQGLIKLDRNFTKNGYWEQAEQVILCIEKTEDKDKILLALMNEMLQKQYWDLAKTSIHKIQSMQQLVIALKEYISHLAHMKQLNEEDIMWLETEVKDHSNSNSKERLELLQVIVNALAQAKEYYQLLRLIRRQWSQSETMEYFIELLSLVTGIFSINQDISRAFYESFVWVNTFLNS